MQEINIDGQEILDWIQKRNKVKPDWAQKLKVLKLKLNEVVSDLKSTNIPEIKECLDKEKRDKDTPLNYADVLEINERLIKSKEAEARTIFGGYASKTIKNVQALVKLFQRDNLHIISLAHEMSQIMTFDLVAAKKNAKSYEHQINDFTTKITLFQTSIKNSRHEIVKLAKKYATNFEVQEENAEKLDFNALINKYVNQFSGKAIRVINALKNIDFPRICSYYARFYEVNNLSKLDNGYFDLLVWIWKNGDTLSSDFNNRTVSNSFTADELYSHILEQKGFQESSSNQVSASENDDMWVIEDISNDNTLLQLPSMDRKTKINFDSIITSPELFDNIIEKVYEVA